MAASPGRLRRRVRSRSLRRLALAITFLLLVLVASLALLRLQRPAPPPSPAAPDSGRAILIAEGILFESGATLGDLRRQEEGGNVSLTFQVDPGMSLPQIAARLEGGLSPLGFHFVSSGSGGDSLTLTALPPTGDKGGITVALLKRVPPPPPALSSSKPTRRPRMAIVIDDLGLSREAAERAVGLSAPVTVAIMPHQPISTETARMARRRGKEVLLHLPMEPLEFPAKDPGPGALLASMSRDEMARVLGDDLMSVPGAVGVNNHMGSRLTAEGEAMDKLMKQLSRARLFFLDSRTTPDSLAFLRARRLGIKAARRDIFLDNLDEPEAIQNQLDELIRLSRSQGEAIGIGHPRENTLTALERSLARIRKAGIDIVPLSHLAR